MFFWLITGFMFWFLFIITGGSDYFIIYYIVIDLLFGILVWINRYKIKDTLVSWELDRLPKFLILGYGMVLFEELFAALSYTLTEGFTLPLYLERIRQYWALNILIFTGFYFAWYFLLKRYRYSYQEVFFIAGPWGLFAEGVIFYPLFIAFFQAPLTIFVYGLMITLPMLSIDVNSELEGKKQLNSLIKYPLSLLIIFLFSTIPFLIVMSLKMPYPWLFPPST